MTLRVRPTTKPRRRTHWQSEERSQFLITLGFVGVIVLTLLALGGAVAADYYNKHLRSVANVGGVGINVDQWGERVQLLSLRISRAERRIREAIASSEIDATTGSTQLSELTTKQRSVTTDALEGLIDQHFQVRLANEMGIAATPEEVDAAQQRESSFIERRKVQAIFVEPKASEENGEVTAAEREAALANVQKALAELNAGKAFAEVAALYSTDASKDRGGDYGTLTQANVTDPAWVEALFSLESGGTTDIIRGQDGVYRIGRITEIIPGGDDPSFLAELEKDGLGSAAYRRQLEREVVSDKLVEKVVADALTGEKDQVQLAEIYIAREATDGEETGADTGQVKVRHILYSPKGDPTGAGDLPADDPAWAESEAAAKATADRLAAIADLAARETEFEAIARADSDDTGSGARGGQLDFTSRSGFVTEFSDAIFDGEHTKGEIIGPVKSDFGYHVILWQSKRGPAAERIAEMETMLSAPGADFAALAKEHSEGRTAAAGGLLGWNTREQLQQEVADAVFALQAGQATGNVELEDGVHWYRVMDRKPRPLDADQRAVLLTAAEGATWPKAFEDWYVPKKETAEADGVITRDDSVLQGGGGGGGEGEGDPGLEETTP
jgi:parvulin-like peptidyl-prolyl isomerase